MAIRSSRWVFGAHAVSVRGEFGLEVSVADREMLLVSVVSSNQKNVERPGKAHNLGLGSELVQVSLLDWC